MIGQYYNVSKALRWGIFAFTLPQIPSILYQRGTNNIKQYLSELTRGKTEYPFNINVQNKETNRMGRAKQYKGDSSNWDFAAL